MTSTPGEGHARPLRVAVLLDGFEVPRWVEVLLRDIAASKVAEVVLVVRNAAPPPPRRSVRQRLALKARYALYEWYTARDDARHSSPDDPFQPADLGPLLAHVPTLDVVPAMTLHTDAFSDADVARIRAYDLDVALRFGFRILKGQSLAIARYGVWSYHHGDDERYRGGPAGFWEVYEDDPVTGSVLQVLSEALDAGRIIYKSFASTNRYSVRKNRNGYYWKTADFVCRKLRDVHRLGAEGLATHTVPASGWHGYARRLYGRPTNGEMVRFLARISLRRMQARLRERLLKDQWFLAYQFGGPRAAGCARESPVPAGTMYRMRRLHPPRDRFWADPFPLAVDGRHWVFFEDCPYDTGKGVIAVMELGRDGPRGEPVTVLDRPYHLSYPFVFRWEGQVYMIPESSERRTVELYRAVEFPYRWELDRVLLEGAHAQDATLVEYQGRWWMFVAMQRAGVAPWDELHLFHAGSPHGPWVPHPMNPIKSDARSARPAGRLFVADGALYRPAQDCSVRYGYAIRVHEVLRMDEECYVEREISAITPDWAPDVLGTHTLNADAGLTVVDGLRRIRR